ncbi:MAG: 5-methyltetrahydropteroyltriglutamate--homocysteine S-methyltransferase [Planctomycetota bacterium]|nr:5-methyltetrahydropteroyltriglutamate--homocysteine S-methyltransferase [Planctomycetota bacterium]
MPAASNLGFPRIGRKRELKKALESYWSGACGVSELEAVGAELRKANWRLQRDAGIDHIPSNDFSFYDHVLDTCAMVGAVPDRYAWKASCVDLDTYFAMARGIQDESTGRDVIAMEMTKWFDTNYHYIVPEFAADQKFTLASTKAIDEFNEAKGIGVQTRPVLLGPLSFLMLGKTKDPAVEPLDLLDHLVGVYEEVLTRLGESGAEWVQMDEPCLVLDLDAKQLSAYQQAYTRLRSAAGDLKILLATYFGDLGESLDTTAALPVDGLHVDLIRSPDQLDALLQRLPQHMVLSAGVVDGRNVWVNDLARSLAVLERIQSSVGPDRLIVAPSCSMIHVPIDLGLETQLDTEVHDWLAFAEQKLDEIVGLTRAMREGRDAVSDLLTESRRRIDSRRRSSKVHRQDVKDRAAGIRPGDASRASPFSQRRLLQKQKLGLPRFPTTTIGSFPQTPQMRTNRAALRNGKITREQYERFLEAEIAETIRFQEEIGLDVLVHGEPERNDMVQYFGEQLTGFAFTQQAWVQSYGSRYVRPPIIYGDVSRPQPMTVRWATYAASLTDKPIKAMLTGPITMLQWSFVRDDQSRRDTARQIALAVRDEVGDLEAAGIGVIQIDEPAIREGLPLRRHDWPAYLEWAVECFRIASSCVRDDTQIHTHMCYAEFNDIVEAIAALDADVISIESSRSQMELLDAFESYDYPNEIGPGVYDIHSPRIPSAEEMRELLSRATRYLSADQVWVNPDCGLKTRCWEEIRPALRNMVQAAQAMRAELAEVR